MNNPGKIILSTAYLPPIEYFALFSSGADIVIERFENYRKQSYRNRCHIYSANGLLSLNIPVIRDSALNTPITQARIDYSINWQLNHWRAITSAYKSSAFFDYFADNFYPFYSNKDFTFLYEYNFNLLKVILELTGLRINISETEIFEKNPSGLDLRYLIHPKLDYLKTNNGQYHQVFAHKSGFLENLSVIDLLFNEGPAAEDFLKLKFESYSK